MPALLDPWRARLRPALIAVLVLLIAFAARAEAGDACKPLVDSLSVSFDGMPRVIRAGEELSFRLKVDLRDSSVLSGWTFVHLTVLLKNSIPGSAMVQFVVPLKGSGAVGRLTMPLTDRIPRNFSGPYKVAVDLFAQGGQAQYCASPVRNLQPASLFVINNPGSADIDPPRVTRVKFDHDSCVRGETVRLSFDARDKSPICLTAQQTPGGCQAVWHLELKPMDGGAELNSFEPIVKTGDNRYEVPVIIPKDARPGAYRVTIVNVYDVCGNASADLPPSEQAPINVR